MPKISLATLPWKVQLAIFVTLLGAIVRGLRACSTKARALSRAPGLEAARAGEARLGLRAALAALGIALPVAYYPQALVSLRALQEALDPDYDPYAGLRVERGGRSPQARRGR